MKHYKKIILDDGTAMDLHRHIYEEYIGRKLTSGEIVHHINGDKSDNRIENLQLMTRREHAKIHLDGKTPSKAIASSAAKRRGVARESARKASNADIMKAFQMYLNGERNRKIEEECGVTAGTIYKMLDKKYARYKEFEQIIDQINKKIPRGSKRAVFG